MQKQILGITGASGSGKTTLSQNLEQFGFKRVVSHTTRPIRANEVEGEDYYYVSPEFFSKESAGLKFVEEIKLYNNQYGLHINELNRIWSMSRVPVVILDPIGMEQTAGYCLRRNVEFISLYLECEVSMLVERYLGRVVVEVHQKGMFEFSKDLKYHASRVIAIFDEKAEWRKKYDLVQKSYHLRGGVVGNYSALTQDVVHREILKNFTGKSESTRDFYRIQESIVEWANQTFPTSNDQTVIHKLALEEIPELIIALSKRDKDKIKDEMADVMILLMDLSFRQGVDILKEVIEKMKVNKNRNWEINDLGVSNHIKSNT